jgi:hypothetical protein
MLAAWMLTAAMATASVPDDEAMKAGQQAWANVLDAAARSVSARERALAASVPAGWPESDAQRLQRGRALREAARSAPTDEVVQWLWATASDADSGCDARDPCPERRMALSLIAPDNAFAWTPAFQGMRIPGDEAAAGELLHRMAGARFYAEPYVPLVDAWRDLLRQHPLPDSAIRRNFAGLPAGMRTREGANAATAIALAAATALPPGPFRFCDGTRDSSPKEETLADCRKVAALMLAAPTMTQRSIGSAMLWRAGGDIDPEAMRRQVQWWQSVFHGMEDDSAEFTRYLEDLHSTQSEIAALELALQRSGRPLEPPADWVYQPPRALVEALEKAAAEAREETGEAVKAPARPATPSAH